MANKDDKCTITLKNVPCDLKTYYLQSGHANDRCLSKEIINVLKRVKEEREQPLVTFSSIGQGSILERSEPRARRR